MIFTDFWEKSRYYSISLGFLNLTWWIGWYIHPLKRLHTWSNKRIKAAIYEYIRKENNNIVSKYNDYNYPHNKVTDPIIWVFWLQGEGNMPELVKGCYKQLTKNNNNVVLITIDNLWEYLDNDSDLKSKFEDGKLLPAHISDILRQALLAKYGGLWVDATCFLPYQVPDWVYNMEFVSPHTDAFIGSHWVSWCLGTNVTNNTLFAFTSEILTSTAKKRQVFPHYLFQDFVMQFAFDNINGVKEIITSCPENAVKRNGLHFMLNKAFNQKDYNLLIENCWIFKLSYKTDWRKYDDKSHLSFYGKLIIDN